MNLFGLVGAILLLIIGFVGKQHATILPYIWEGYWAIGWIGVCIASITFILLRVV